MSTYLQAMSQAHNLASHSNHQALGISSRILFKHNGKVLIPRLWVADSGQDIGAGAMQIIDTSIKSNVVDAPTDHTMATAFRVTGLDTVLYSALLIGLTGCALLAADLAAWSTLTAPLTLRAWVEGLAQRVVAALVEAATLAHRHAGVATEHKAGIADAALPAGWLTAFWRREAGAAHRAGVTTELVVAVGRALEGCGDKRGWSRGRCRVEGPAHLGLNALPAFFMSESVQGSERVSDPPHPTGKFSVGLRGPGLSDHVVCQPDQPDHAYLCRSKPAVGIQDVNLTEGEARCILGCESCESVPTCLGLCQGQDSTWVYLPGVSNQSPCLMLLDQFLCISVSETVQGHLTRCNFQGLCDQGYLGESTSQVCLAVCL